jgi:hypothetical protein
VGQLLGARRRGDDAARSGVAHLRGGAPPCAHALGLEREARAVLSAYVVSWVSIWVGAVFVAMVAPWCVHVYARIIEGRVRRRTRDALHVAREGREPYDARREEG